MAHDIQLLIIDPQNDFCDLPPDWRPADLLTGRPTPPSLPVAGAHADMLRVADFIRAMGDRLSAITVTLDSHGSWGHNVHPAVKAAYNEWEDRHLTLVQKINKGSNPWTEHYSALQAEVPDPADPHTQLNTALIDALDAAGTLVICGEASSHCVRATTEHLVANLPSRKPGKLVLLTDCMSPVGGFEAQQTAFLDGMRAQGARLMTSAAFIAAN